MQSTFAEVIWDMGELVEAHRSSGRPFSAWQSHCLRSALFSLRIGHHDQARKRLSDAIHPPEFPPVFPYAGPITIAEIDQAVSELTTAPVMASLRGKGEPASAGV
jgi:hypothetical protein